MNIDNKNFNFYLNRFSSLFSPFQTIPQSLKIAGIVLTSLVGLTSLLYAVYRIKRRSSLKAKLLTRTSFSPLFQQNLNPNLAHTHQAKEINLKSIQKILEQNSQTESVDFKFICVSTDLLRQLIQKDLPLNQEEINKLLGKLLIASFEQNNVCNIAKII